ncbi:MAG: type II secretion system F family protein [Candidatus Hydrogenedentales bacterium]|jgi:type IV pilus assembly protein PilC
MGLFSPQIDLKKMVPLCRQLATTHDAGIPIVRALDVVGRQQKDRQVREMLIKMNDSIKDGSSLAEAARAQSRLLPTFFIELIASGERGGKLDVMLRDLAQYFEDRLAMQRQITRAMTYPIIQLMFAWFCGTFALRLIPKVTAGIAGKGEPFDLMAYFREYAIFQAQAMLVFATVFAVCVVLSRLGYFGYVWGFFATKVWPLSTVTKKFGLARFFRSMSLLIGSGLRIDHCVESSAAVTANPYMQKDLVKAIPLIRDGCTLVEAFTASRYLTPTAREMIHIGEISGQLETALRKVSQYHLDEATHAVNIATKVFSVLIGLAMAGLVGYIIITFYMRLYGGMFDALGV